MKTLILIILLLISTLAYSTEPTDTIRSESIDIEYLEKLAFEKINNHCSKYRLKKLTSDSALYIGYKNHSNWMYDNDSLVHASEEELNYYWTQECASANWILYDVITYDKMADRLVNGWMNSKRHNQILLTKGAIDASVAISKYGNHKLDDSSVVYVYLTFRIDITPTIY